MKGVFNFRERNMFLIGHWDIFSDAFFICQYYKVRDIHQ